jgi:hypothetical protein
MNKPIASEEIEAVTRHLLKKKNPGSDVFRGESKHLKKN